MRQVILIKGESPEEYVANYNEITAELSRSHIVDQYHLSDTKSYIYYETDELDPEWFGRVCCECSHYDLAKGCLYKSVRRDRKSQACGMFTTEIIESMEVQS